MSTKTFKRIILLTIPVLLLCILFALLIYFGNVRIKTTTLLEDPRNQLYYMTLSKEIKSIESVEILPSIVHSITNNDLQISIRFDEQLKYNEEYTVEINVLDSKQNSIKLFSKFKTSEPDIFYLQRNELTNDFIFKTKLSQKEPEIIYSADTILLYEKSPSTLLVLEELEKEQRLYIKNTNNRIRNIEIPENHNVDYVSASTSKDSYVLSLTNSVDFRRTIWIYESSSSELFQLKNMSQALEGVRAEYASDGVSIFYTDESQNLILLSENNNQSPLLLGQFSEISRILPNDSGIFGLKSNKFTTVLSQDGSQVLAPEIVQNGSQAQRFNNSESYVFIDQSLDNNLIHQKQLITVTTGSDAIILSESPLKENLILDIELSPNDQFLVSEESSQPVITDGKNPNSKPINGISYIRSVSDGSLIKSVNGYDIKWVIK